MVGADRCGAMVFATINGNVSETCCPGAMAMWGRLRRIIAGSSRQCSIAIVPVFRGVTCRSASGIGRTCIVASADGPSRAFGKGFSATWPWMPITNTR